VEGAAVEFAYSVPLTAIYDMDGLQLPTTISVRVVDAAMVVVVPSNPPDLPPMIQLLLFHVGISTVSDVTGPFGRALRLKTLGPPAIEDGRVTRKIVCG
jgi:hypothetical protein